ncbi:MAG: cyanophycin synthetase, partial [Candidatus Magasanikbacteria bacterium]|nr:cyanophycin synthetase [Candidatus Magasanikbacteria bacterium]
MKKIAPRIGAKVIIEQKYKIVGQINYKDGKRRYFRYSTVDLNSVGASEISKDKDYATFFMKKMGYPTIRGKAFFSHEWSKAIGSPLNIDAAYRHATKIGFPVAVKPNSGSQGFGVSLVYNKNDFYKALKFIFKKDK